METKCVLSKADFDALRLTFEKIKRQNEGLVDRIDLPNSINVGL